MFYYYLNGQKMGPVSLPELKELETTGAIGSDTEVEYQYDRQLRASDLISAGLIEPPREKEPLPQARVTPRRSFSFFQFPCIIGALLLILFFFVGLYLLFPNIGFALLFFLMFNDTGDPNAYWLAGAFVLLALVVFVFILRLLVGFLISSCKRFFGTKEKKQ